MAKPLSIVAIALLCSLSAFAQSGEAFSGKGNSMRTAGRITGPTARLKGSTHWGFSNGALVQADSVRYAYSGNNGWGGDLVGWKFDTRVKMELDNARLNNSSRYTSTFDERKHITAQTYENWNFTRKDWEKNRRTVYSYTGDGKVATYESQVWDENNWDTRYRVSNIYNANGTLAETVDQQRAAKGSFVNHTKTVKTYNALELPESDTFYTWKTNEWQVSGITSYFYSGRQLREILHHRRDAASGAMGQKNATSYTYDEAGKEKESTSRVFENGAWIIQNKTVRDYDDEGNLKNWVLQHYINGEFINRRQTTCTYTSQGQLASETYKTWNATKKDFEFRPSDFIDRYYYEPYKAIAKNEVPSTNTLQAQFDPSSNTLKLTFKWSEKQSATISLLDMNGKVVGQWSAPAAILHSQVIDIAGIPAGNYLVKVSGTKQQLIKQASVAR